MQTKEKKPDVLRRRYAKKFDLPIEEVELDEFEYDLVVYAKNRVDLPQWTFEVPA